MDAAGDALNPPYGALIDLARDIDTGRDDGYDAADTTRNRWRGESVSRDVTAHPPRRRTERRGLRLWPVGTVLVLTFAAVLPVSAAADLQP
ncbi:hypothetical protein ABZ642_45005 [Streptomyces sp. NPDC007157]|uniref:hypothetical protein n=1 Tax=Streptomyces sp. NPDC007157 TaxID=3154681 RepID=UPI0033E591CB